MFQNVTAPAVANNQTHHPSKPESIVVINLTGIDPSAATPYPSRGRADSERVGPKPRTTKPQMLQAFRQLRHQRVQHDEASQVMQSIVDAGGPDSLRAAIQKHDG